MLTGIPLYRDWDRSPPKTIWRQPIGLGWSAFAVSGQHAVTQEQRREDELIVCYDLQTGHALWAHTNRVRFSETLGGDGPRATPTLHKGRVYAMGASGILDCLEEATGQLIWSRDVLRENHLSNLTWGKSCSPLLVQDLVVVTGGEQREKTLLAYEAATGKPVWQAGRDRASYCSPLLASLCGQEQILMVNGHSVTGHDPHHGEILWEYAWPPERSGPRNWGKAPSRNGTVPAGCFGDAASGSRINGRAAPSRLGDHFQTSRGIPEPPIDPSIRVSRGTPK